jgi:hypothetical protein
MVGLLVPKLSDQSDENEGTDYCNTWNIAKALLALGGENARVRAMPEEVCRPGYPRNMAANERERSVCGCNPRATLSALRGLLLDQLPKRH